MPSKFQHNAAPSALASLLALQQGIQATQACASPTHQPSYHTAPSQRVSPSPTVVAPSTPCWRFAFCMTLQPTMTRYQFREEMASLGRAQVCWSWQHRSRYWSAERTVDLLSCILELLPEHLHLVYPKALYLWVIPAPKLMFTQGSDL
uniref:Uncharacterized protein n=1 Tax=Dromaius novaehollandiae TaxID=8790 RepID=A0A8C4J3H3_DRONO